jgi:hypothetical protein
MLSSRPSILRLQTYMSSIGGDFIGRAKTILGDEVGRDKVERDAYYVSGGQLNSSQVETNSFS